MVSCSLGKLAPENRSNSSPFFRNKKVGIDMTLYLSAKSGNASTSALRQAETKLQKQKLQQCIIEEKQSMKIPSDTMHFQTLHSLTASRMQVQLLYKDHTM